MAQLVRAPPCHGGSRGFESHSGRFSGILAQLGEHLPYKQRVTGSSPVGPIWRVSHVSMIAVVAELADAQDLKSCGTNLPCRFDSGLRHLRKKSLVFTGLFLFFNFGIRSLLVAISKRICYHGFMLSMLNYIDT